MKLLNASHHLLQISILNNAVLFVVFFETKTSCINLVEVLAIIFPVAFIWVDFLYVLMFISSVRRQLYTNCDRHIRVYRSNSSGSDSCILPYHL